MDTNRNQSNDKEALANREAEATTDETLTDLEEEQEIADTSDSTDIPEPDAEPTRRDNQDLM